MVLWEHLSNVVKKLLVKKLTYRKLQMVGTFQPGRIDNLVICRLCREYKP